MHTYLVKKLVFLNILIEILKRPGQVTKQFVIIINITLKYMLSSQGKDQLRKSRSK